MNTFTTTDTTLATIVAETKARKEAGKRLCAMTALQVDETSCEIIYTFDKDLELEHLRLTVQNGETVPSVSPVFLCAFLYENEMIDQFGLSFSDLAIDFGGTLYLEENVRRTPFCKYSTVENGSAEQAEG